MIHPTRQILLICFFIFQIVGNANALDFKQKDNVVFVTGSNIDFVDVGRFEKAFANGANTVVFSKIGGSRTDVLSGIGRLIQKAHVTTVATDTCGPSCAYLFMAGDQRLVGISSGTVNPEPMFLLLAGATTEGTINDAHATEMYAYFSVRFGKEMPHDLLNKYTTGGKSGQIIYFARPSDSFPDGQVGECRRSEDKKGFACTPVIGLTSLQVGAITSSSPYLIDADSN